MEQEYQKLEQNLIDLIKEEQMKLGYQKETIRLYYPADSLLRLLGKELSIRKTAAGAGMVWRAYRTFGKCYSISQKKTVSVSVFRQKGQSMYMSRCRTIHF